MTDLHSDESPVYLDRNGRKITESEWMNKRGDRHYRQIARTDIGPRTVITAWFGTTDRNRYGEPLIFGTVVLHTDTRTCSDEVFSATEPDALDSHARLVGWITALDCSDRRTRQLVDGAGYVSAQGWQ